MIFSKFEDDHDYGIILNWHRGIEKTITCYWGPAILFQLEATCHTLFSVSIYIFLLQHNAQFRWCPFWGYHDVGI